jgi:hypothetical protein
LLALCDSKRLSKKHIAPAFKHTIIVTAKAAAPAPAPVAPVVCPACGGTGIKK